MDSECTRFAIESDLLNNFYETFPVCKVCLEYSVPYLFC